VVKKIILSLIVLLIVAFVIISFSIDGIVKGAIEKTGSKLLGAKVSVQSVQLSLWSGSGKIKGVQIDNPAGFKTPYAFKLGKVSISVSLPSLLQDVIVVKSIDITQPNIMFETNATTSNIQAMAAHLNKATSSGAPAVSSQPMAKKALKPVRKSAPSYIVIKHFALTRPVVNGNLGGLATVKMDIPDVIIDNIGTEPKGVTASAATQRILNALTQALSHAKTSVKTTKKGEQLEQFVHGVGKLLHHH